MSDNLWEEDVLDEVKLFNDLHTSPPGSPSASIYGESIGGLLGRRTLAGMLSEALCSRAKSTAEKAYSSQAEIVDERAIPDDDGTTTQQCASASTDDPNIDDVPFARRAREEGRSFRGGKSDGKSCYFSCTSGKSFNWGIDFCFLAKISPSLWQLYPLPTHSGRQNLKLV